ncbi:MAG TPA: glycosyltransferase family A protein [Ferruginibacter sp.]|nr:glycosyltransferase family A protein [Ferruginibacter sp.]
MPLVSILMTAYNREKYIADAIESVLLLSYTNFELIIVDDCSKDNTIQIAKKYEANDSRIKVYENEINLGDYPNRNKAAGYAKGKYLKYLDSDDMIFPGSLSFMVNTMEQYPDAGLGVSSRTVTTTTYLTSKQAYQLHFFERGLLDNGPTGTIINTEKFIHCGGFKAIRNVSDLDMWLRMAAKYPVIEMPKDLIYWREHEGQEINIAPELYAEYNLAILEENLFDTCCPLDDKEIQYIVSKFRRITARGVLKILIKKKKLQLFLKVRKKYKLEVKDFF